MKRILIAFALAGCSPNMPDEQNAPQDGDDVTAPQPPAERDEAENVGSGVDEDVSMELTLNDLEAGDEATSPLRFSGSASGLWYFEGGFPVRLVDGQGMVIAESHASSQSNWMTEDQVPFEGEIRFDVSEATLIFQEDDPSGMKVPAEEAMAIMLLPAQN